MAVAAPVAVAAAAPVATAAPPGDSSSPLLPPSAVALRHGCQAAQRRAVAVASAIPREAVAAGQHGGFGAGAPLAPELVTMRNAPSSPPRTTDYATMSRRGGDVGPASPGLGAWGRGRGAGAPEAVAVAAVRGGAG